MLLAGDIGGTKTILALYQTGPDGFIPIRETTYPSMGYASLEDMVREFLAETGHIPHAACFGVAGPVLDGCCRTTNLPWLVSEQAMVHALGIGKVKLLNDLQAMAMGLLHLGPEDWVELNPGAEPRDANRAVLAPGTGLGEAILYWDGHGYHPLATEGGHADFAPGDAVEDGLLSYLRAKTGGHVSYERILSGPGIADLHAYLRSTGILPEAAEIAALLKQAEDPARVIGQAALERGDPLCRETLRRFARILGAEAGNLALKCLARGGVLIGGGISPKILPALQDGAFLEGFCDKGRFAGFMRGLSVRVALDARTGLRGAAEYAARELP